jgi:hypothetical protein
MTTTNTERLPRHGAFFRVAGLPYLPAPLARPLPEVEL